MSNRNTAAIVAATLIESYDIGGVVVVTINEDPDRPGHILVDGCVKSERAITQVGAAKIALMCERINEAIRKACHDAAEEINSDVIERPDLEIQTAKEGMSEVDYATGKRSALVAMLHHVLRELGYEDTEATRSKWILEREQTIATLRAACEDWGDNNWEPELHLSDVIDKHLIFHVEEL